MWFGESRVLSSFITAVSPWYMASLFLAAGLSARFSLQKRGKTGYVRERIKKLLIPLIIGNFCCTVSGVVCRNISLLYAAADVQKN